LIVFLSGFVPLNRPSLIVAADDAHAPLREHVERRRKRPTSGSAAEIWSCFSVVPRIVDALGRLDQYLTSRAC
jgi:hypothetical protein